MSTNSYEIGDGTNNYKVQIWRSSDCSRNLKVFAIREDNKQGIIITVIIKGRNYKRDKAFVDENKWGEFLRSHGLAKETDIFVEEKGVMYRLYCFNLNKIPFFSRS